MRNITYIARGVVLGNYWGGGRGYYKAEELRSNNLEELREEIGKKVDDGSLDSGMGYESLIGACMSITTREEKEIEGKTFINEESDIEFFDIDNKYQEEIIEILFEMI